MIKANKMMSLRNLFAALFLTCIASAWVAGTHSADIAKLKEDKSADELFQEYKKNFRGSPYAPEILMAVLTRKLSRSGSNIESVRSSLAEARNEQEKEALVRILASLHAPNDRSPANVSIEHDLSVIARSGQKSVARAATFAYSRLGYLPDHYEILRAARLNGLISSEEYMGELAHGLWLAPAPIQLERLAEMDKGNSRYAADILAATFGSTELLSRLYPESKNALYDLLIRAEPAFPMALDSFGMFDAFRYSDWLHVIGTIEATTKNQPYSQLVLERLRPPKTDPRKIIAFFISPEGKRLIQQSDDLVTLQALLARAKQYSYSLPSNLTLKDAVQEFEASMAALTHRE